MSSAIRTLAILATAILTTSVSAGALRAADTPPAAANTPAATAEQAKPIKVLVVGNSQCPIFVYQKFLEKLAASDKGARPIEVIPCVKGGASLKSHWDAGEGPTSARGLLVATKPDFVLLQDIYNVQKPNFEPYAKQFHNFAKEHQVQPVYFGTASIISDFPKGFDRLHTLHIDLSRELKVPIVDASRAYVRYFGENPSKEKMESLFAQDKAHPGHQGSYLYACLIYSTLTGRSPIGLAAPETVPAEVVKPLQEAAWAQYQATAEELKQK